MMRILCYSPYNKWYLHGLWEITILQSLRLRGADVKYVTCDGLYHECDVHWYATNPRTPGACQICKQENATVAEQMGMQFEWISSYIRAEEREEADRWAFSLPPEELPHAQYGQWKIGEWIRSSVHSHFRISVLDFTSQEVVQVYRRYLASGLRAAFALNRLLDEYQPDLLFLFNGRFSSLRIALELARMRSLRVLTHERGWLYESIRLTENCITHDPAQYEQSWKLWQDIPLTEEELDALDAYLTLRRSGKNPNWEAFVPAPQGSSEEIMRMLQLSPEKPIWVLFTSSDDEIASVHSFFSPFRNQFRWITATVDYVAAHPEIQLVLRVHPNIKSQRSVGANLQTYGWFQKMREQLPPNVRLVMPEAQLNSYQLGDLATAILTYGSTMGLEMATQGKYVLSALHGFYRPLQVVQHVYAEQSYHEQLDGLRALPLRAASEVIARQACRFAYTAFFRNSLPFPLVEMPTPRTGRLRYSSLADLQPGKDRTLERIAEIVFEGAPVYETPDEEHWSRSCEQERLWHRRRPYAGKGAKTESNPKVSVVIPCYNHAAHLRHAVESVLMQTEEDLEILIVDDGSTDQSFAIAEKLREENRHIAQIQVFRQSNSGQPAIPRNRGIANARGQYILCLDADDFLAPDYIATGTKLLDATPENVGIVSGDQQDVGVDNTFHRMQEFNAEQLKIYNHLLIASIFRKSLWERIGGFRQNVRGYEDWDFWLAALSRGYTAQHMRSLFFYRCSDTGVFAQTHTHDLQRKAQIVINNATLYTAEQREWAQQILKGNEFLREVSRQIPVGFIPPPQVAHQLLQAAQQLQGAQQHPIAPFGTQREEKPLISVIIPTTFRSELLLKDAIQSVLQQTYQLFEILVVADGVEIPSEFQRSFTDPRIRFLATARRRGPAAARNVGIHHARGEYILFLDDDDRLLPSHLENYQEKIAAHPDAVHYSDSWSCVAEIRDGEIHIEARQYRKSEEYHPLRLLVGNCAPVPTFLVPRKLLRSEILFDESLPVHEDWDFWLRLSRHAQFHYHPFASVEIRKVRSLHRLSDRYAEFLRTTEILYRRYCEQESKIPELREARKLHLAFLRQQAFENLKEDTVSIIIPVHNHLRYTKQCLEAIPYTTGNIPYEVIVIDNASETETANYLRTEAAAGRITLLRNEENRPYAQVNNQGAAVARGKYLVFLNNDTKPLDGWLEAIVEEFHSHPQTGIVGAKLLYGNGRIQHAGMVFGARPGRPEEPFHAYLLANPNAPFVNRRRKVQFVTGACLAIPKKIFEQVDGFDERYVFGWEDADLCMKVQQCGYEVIYQPRAVLYHYESVTKKLRQQQGQANFADDAPHEQANRQLFLQKWGDRVQRDMEAFFAEDGFILKGDKLVRSEAAESQILTSFAPRFWQRNYSNAKTVLIKSTDAFGDTLAITSVVATLKKLFPHLNIFVVGGQRTLDIFHQNQKVAAVLDVNAAEVLAMEAIADEIIDYTNIIARLPEYYNGIGYRDIFGNLAGIPFQYEQIDYVVLPEERQWAEKQLRKRWGNPPEFLIGLHLISNKEAVPNKRNYPYGTQLIELLHERFPHALFLSFGTAPLPQHYPFVLDLAKEKFSLREQIALSSWCTHFITIDSGFFHVGHNLWKKPTLLICGLTNPLLSGNPDAGFAYVRNESLSCLECYWQIHCQNECMVHLPPEKVGEAFADMVHNGVPPLPELTIKRIRITAAEQYEYSIAKHLFRQKPAHRLVIEDPEGVLPDYAHQWNGVTVLQGRREGEEQMLYDHKPEVNNNRSTVASVVSTTPEQPTTEQNFEKDSASVAAAEHVPEEKSQQGRDGGAESASPLIHIVWEGSQFVTHSLALINRAHCLNLLKVPGIKLTIVPYERDQYQPDGNSDFEKLSQVDIRNTPVEWETVRSLPTLWIRHQWPPKAEAPPIGKWVIMQPWEFSHLRKDFVEIFRKADGVWTPSNFSRNAMLRSGVEFDKVQIVPNGIDPSRYTPFGEAYPLETKKRFRFLYVGGTIFRKGIDILLHAYVKSFTAADDVVLVIKDLGGDSFYKGQTASEIIRKVQQMPNAPEILYIDEILSEEEMAKLYRSCHVLVAPYRGEGFALPVLEAMACGLAVIVTEGGATDDFVDHRCGWKLPAKKRSIGSQIDGHDLSADAWVLEPDGDTLLQLLQFVYHHPHEALLRGICGSTKARRFWTWERATLRLLTQIDCLLNTDLRQRAKDLFQQQHDAPILVGEAEEALESGNVDRAIALYEAALTQRGLPQRYALLVIHRLALLSLQIHQYQLAQEFLEKARSIADPHPDTIYLEALHLELRHQYEEALEKYRLLLSNWEHWKFLSNLGYGKDAVLYNVATIFKVQGKVAAAISTLEQAMRENPHNTEVAALLTELQQSSQPAVQKE